MRAIRLAKAMIATCNGLRASILASQPMLPIGASAPSEPRCWRR
jgi:hypothetical protein